MAHPRSPCWAEKKVPEVRTINTSSHGPAINAGTDDALCPDSFGAVLFQNQTLRPSCRHAKTCYSRGFMMSGVQVWYFRCGLNPIQSGRRLPTCKSVSAFLASRVSDGWKFNSFPLNVHIFFLNCWISYNITGWSFFMSPGRLKGIAFLFMVTFGSNLGKQPREIKKP